MDTFGNTRQEIMLRLLHDGPLTASDLGAGLGLSAAGVRRHLDILVDDGLAEVVTHRRRGSRGRPAKAFRLTDAGRNRFGHDYDNLAALALSSLREAGGDEAVRTFARRRIREILGDIAEDIDATDPDAVEATARALAEQLGQHGYATTVSHVGHGIQLCQHHCPISHVAAEFPEICEAEREFIAEALGRHVQALATIVEGHGVCTTNIPLTPIHHSPSERSGS